MNKKFTYTLFVLFFLAAGAFVVLRYQKKLEHKRVAFYPLQERKGSGAATAEWASVKSRADKLIRIVRDNPYDIKSSLQLATLYIQEARITGNHTYYDAAAMNYIKAVLEKDAQNFEALTLQALVYLSQHHFTDALAVAQKAQQIAPYNAFVYGLLIDAHVELGNYEEAVASAEQMISIRPDIRSYARIAYLREIHGDNEGAIEAMQKAVKAGGASNEPVSWARIQLARLYENEGDLRSAEMHYTIALDQRPGYAYALAGLAHVAAARNDYTKALSFYQQASASVSDDTFLEEEAKLHFRMGQKEKGEALVQKMIRELSKAVQQGEGAAGHHSDKELAEVYVLANEPAKALQHALAEYNRRPTNIEVNETVAWAYYKNGEAQKALPYIKQALRTNCKNPTLLCRAGLIYAATGDKVAAAPLLRQALEKNPSIDEALKQEGSVQLQAIATS